MSGVAMSAEMAEQPDVVRRLAAGRGDLADRLSRLAPRPLGIVLSARGSSANAAILGRHALTLATARPVTIEPLSLAAEYGAEVDRRGWLHLATSQSGHTREIVSAVELERRMGARSVAITNSPVSPLADAADMTLALQAGPELAVPATKTVLAQLVAFVHLAAAYDPRFRFHDAVWERLAGGVEACLADRNAVSPLVDGLRSCTSLMITGRGYGFAAAREGALKIKETSRLPAEATTHLELLHGPIAVTGPQVVTVVVRLEGPTDVDARRLTAALEQRHVPFWTIGDVADADVLIPAGLPEPLATALAVVRFQQLAYELALERDIDPDRPNGLSKVTAS
jgi:glucosamine--fructose-6-phosphate aminotransferase (isomerizing)